MAYVSIVLFNDFVHFVVFILQIKSLSTQNSFNVYVVAYRLIFPKKMYDFCFLKHNTIVLLGYCTGDNYKDVRPIDVFCLNTTNYRWTALKKPKIDSIEEDDWPFQRYGHTVVAHGRKIYLFGGRNDNHSCNRLYCFDTKTFKWTSPQPFGSIPSAR